MTFRCGGRRCVDHCGNGLVLGIATFSLMMTNFLGLACAIGRCLHSPSTSKAKIPDDAGWI
jgi:hypothetical protein